MRPRIIARADTLTSCHFSQLVLLYSGVQSIVWLVSDVTLNSTVVWPSFYTFILLIFWLDEARLSALDPALKIKDNWSKLTMGMSWSTRYGYRMRFNARFGLKTYESIWKRRWTWLHLAKQRILTLTGKLRIGFVATNSDVCSNLLNFLCGFMFLEIKVKILFPILTVI